MMYTKKQDKFAATFEEKTKECPLYARNMLALESMEFSRKEINMTKKYDEKEIRADYRRLTKLLIEKKDDDHHDGIGNIRADRFSDHRYRRLIGSFKGCVCYLLQRSENYAGRSGRSY